MSTTVVLDELCALLSELRAGAPVCVVLTPIHGGSEQYLASAPTGECPGEVLIWSADLGCWGEHSTARLNVYARTAHEPSASELRLFERTAAIARAVCSQHSSSESVRADEQRWRSIFQSSAIGIGLSDMDGRLVA